MIEVTTNDSHECKTAESCKDCNAMYRRAKKNVSAITIIVCGRGKSFW